MNCLKCGKPLSFNEEGLNTKYNRGGEKRCIRCLAGKLGVTEERLREKIAEFLGAGCTMFVREE